MTPRSYAATVLSLCGLILMGIGLFFVFLRPPLLPEDVHSMGTSAAALGAIAPGLLQWLEKVFWVLGGYIFTTGLLTLYVARTMLHRRDTSAVIILAIAGITSIGWMAVVNFLLNSAFKWLLLGVALLWGLGLLLTQREAHTFDAEASQSL